MTASTAKPTLPRQQFFTPLELGEIFRVHKRTIVTWIKDPDTKLTGVKLGNLWRVPYASVVEFMEELYGQPQR